VTGDPAGLETWAEIRDALDEQTTQQTPGGVSLLHCPCGALYEPDDKNKHRNLHNRFCPEHLEDHARVRRFEERFGRELHSRVEDIYAELERQPTQERVQ
jgi:hypothetical protein